MQIYKQNSIPEPDNQKTREGCGCPKFHAGKVFRQISTLLENDSPIFRQREMLSLPRFGHFPARKTAAGKLAAPAGTLLDFLLRDRHSLLEVFWDNQICIFIANALGPAKTHILRGIPRTYEINTGALTNNSTMKKGPCIKKGVCSPTPIPPHKRPELALCMFVFGGGLWGVLRAWTFI